MRSRLIKALNNRFYVKFMQLEIGLLSHNDMCLSEVLPSKLDWVLTTIEAFWENIGRLLIFSAFWNLT